MAPNFFQKFVKSSTSNLDSSNSGTPRERVSSDVYSSLRSPTESVTSSTSSGGKSRARAATTSNGSSSSLASPTTPTQASVTLKSFSSSTTSASKSPSRRSSTNNSSSTGTGDSPSQSTSRIPSIITTLSGRSRSKSNKDREKQKEKEKSEKEKDRKKSLEAEKKKDSKKGDLTNRDKDSLAVAAAGDRTSWGSAYSSQPNFTIVPPSPLVHNGDLYSSSDDEDEDTRYQQKQREPNTAEPEDTVATPTLPSFSPGQDQGASKNSNNANAAGKGSAITSNSKSTSNTTTSTSPPISTSTNKNTTTTEDADNDNDMSNLAPGAYQVRKKTSNQSIKNKKGGVTPPEINVAAAVATLGGASSNYNSNANGNTASSNGTGGHMRAATAPADSVHRNGGGGNREEVLMNGAVTMRPIVESPTDLKFPASASSSSGANATPGASSITASTSNSTSASVSSNSTSNLGAPGGGGGAGLQRENTTSSILSPSADAGGKSKRPWRRSTTRKPTGLASAIAASGLAMANPSLSAAHNAQMPQVPVPPPALSAGSSKDRDKDREKNDPYMSRSPAQSAVSSGGKGRKNRSGELSPRSSKSRKSSVGSPPRSGGGGRSRRASSARSADGANEFGALRPAGPPDDASASYYLDDSDRGSNNSDSDSDSGSGSLSSDDLLDIGEEDIPVTGFAVASNKRNADFHELFPGVPEGDYLIEDYGCALQREILIQGRIYISENHICFHANIFGWITDLSIPIYEITSLEKKMTAFVIPNAIQITTRQAKYTFASFLSRDTTFDVIFNIWRLARPEDNVSYMSSGRGSVEGSVLGGINGAGAGKAGGAGAATAANGVNGVSVAAPVAAPAGAPPRKATQCTCGKENKHYSETAMDVTIPGTPEKINSLMFTSGFIKDFMVRNQKLLDIQMSDWSPVVPGSKLLTRNFSYIKPLNGSLGPKQTKCELKDEMVYCDFDQYVSTVTTTRTPDVPSGGVFSVKTRTCVTWAGPISTRVLVTTQVEWTGRSFIKGIIERSAIDGQKVYHAELEKSMRAYIQEHKSEFLPEGIDASIALVAPPEAAPGAPAVIEKAVEAATEKHPTQEELKQRERERNARGLQWAWDTFDGAWQVAGRSTKGALELIRDAWDQSTSTTILWFVIVVLVLSNIWTLMRMGSGRDWADRKIKARKVEDREKWVQSIVTALWHELNDKAAVAGTGMPGQVVLPPQHSQGQATVQQPVTVVEPSDQAPLSPTPSVTILPYPQDDLEARRVRKAHLDLEVQQLCQSLKALEQRAKTIRETLANDLAIDTLD
ncbi:hypothetical protein CVT25_002634 [Psilocybe cyanescens]|uniref:VASt domain-containing protein n=1 Tax=Psilocybe cyanescens TaxID=93625 RepID=A0A409WLG5_PSICY|nr:hypothetical protein CVT25_002634 [Psilocybe cyanescens]